MATLRRTRGFIWAGDVGQLARHWVEPLGGRLRFFDWLGRRWGLGVFRWSR